MKSAANPYSGGIAGSSTDSGTTWTMDSGGDFLFEEWGTAISPMADFSAAPVKGPLPLEVTFTDLTVGGTGSLTYAWDFGDGQTSTLQNPVNIYSAAGKYTVILTVTDEAEHESTKTKTDYIFVQSTDILIALSSEVDKTPGSMSAWTDVDLSGQIATGAPGALLHIVNTDAAAQTWGVRNNGSSDNITGSIDPGCQTWAYIGLDSNGKFEGYVTSANVKIFIYGYSQYGIAFINAIEKTISAGWHDINCAANASSDTIGLIFIVKNSSADTIRSYGIRKNGSTDSYTLGEAGLLEIGPGQTQFVIIGCDTAQLCEFYPSDASDIHLYLIGYIFDGTTFQIIGSLVHATRRALPCLRTAPACLMPRRRQRSPPGRPPSTTAAPTEPATQRPRRQPVWTPQQNGPARPASRGAGRATAAAPRDRPSPRRNCGCGRCRPLQP